MKLAIDCRMIGSGGIGTYLCGLLPYFIENHQCLLLGDGAALEEFRGKAGVEILPCAIKPFSVKELFCFPSPLLKKINGCAAYYSPYCNIPGRLFCGGKLSGGIRVPIFTTIHDVVFLDIPELAGGLGTAVRKWFYQYAVKHSRCVFTVSQFSAGRIASLLKGVDFKAENADSVFQDEAGGNAADLAVDSASASARLLATPPGTPLVVTYNAVPHWFTEDSPEGGAAERENSLLFVGNIKAHKGLHVLLPAFKLARQKGLAGRLVIVGNAHNFRTGDSGILEQLQSLSDEEVSFTGRVSDGQLRNLYRRCKLLVQPSLYEGFGMPPLEALSQGTNVVLSDIPVFREIYSGLPVTFFKAGDVEDLAEKLLSAWELPPPSPLENRYSFKKSSDIIFDTIGKIVAAGGAS